MLLRPVALAAIYALLACARQTLGGANGEQHRTETGPYGHGTPRRQFFKELFDLSKITSMEQLEEWEARVVHANGGAGVRVYATHPSFLDSCFGGNNNGTGEVYAEEDDGSFLMKECPVPCRVRFSGEAGEGGRPVDEQERISEAHVLLRADPYTWTPDELAEIRAAHPDKRAVFAGWESIGWDQYRERYKLNERLYDWLVSYSVGEPFAADVPCAYNVHSESDYRGATYIPPSAAECGGAGSPVFMAVSHCNQPRADMLQTFDEALRIDSYGRCLHNSEVEERMPACTGLGREAEKRCLMRCYPFLMSIENSWNMPDYATEKLFEPLAKGIVPIYLGPTNEAKLLPHPSAAILVRDFLPLRPNELTPDVMRRVAEHVQAVASNATAMAELQAWRQMAASDWNFGFRLRLKFSFKSLFCNLCTRYAAERMGIGYNATAEGAAQQQGGQS